MNGKNYGNRPPSQGQRDGRPHGGPGKPYGGGNQQPALEKITAPYNFVPLSRKVFFPDWADQVSHDIPFADAISGELVCELTTDTPVYVRNGGKWKPEEKLNNPEAQSFFRVGDIFMIPSTSLKGMLRNVIEIASFGKMNKVDDHRYSVRDLHNKQVYMNRMKNVQAGWLRQTATGDGWEVMPCEYALVSHELLRNESIKNAQKSLDKYKTWGWNKLEVRFRYKKGSLANRVTKLGEGDLGTLVFTGQPKANTGGKFDKKNEFVFFSQSGNPIMVSDELRKDIEFLYTNPNTGKSYDEWAHWRAVLQENKKVPVFFQLEGGRLASLGFTRMYRLPYKYKVKEAIINTSAKHTSTKPDFAETVFGFVDGSNQSLKGRISISPAIADMKTVKPFPETVTAVLGSPKPTFYPNYINQPEAGIDGKITGEYRTFMDKDVEIRGWKRYPVRQLGDVVRKPEVGRENVATTLIPLAQDAKFTFSIKVHNLKPVELSSLLWALTWGGKDNLRHSLGMGKSLGYGVVGIKLASQSLRDVTGSPVNLSHVMDTFPEFMDKDLGGGWLKTSQMEQLLAMANPQLTPQCGHLRHLSLANKDFSNAKGSSKPFRPKLTLLPHVRPTAISDQERFRDLKATLTITEPHREATVPAKPADDDSMAALLGKFGKKR